MPQSAAQQIEQILRFWFGDALSAAEIAAQQSKLWFGKDPAVDAEIARRFGELSNAAGSGKLDSWAQSPRGMLALILCTDQFPRNIHRDSRRAFALDSIALGWAKRCVDSQFAQQLRAIERVFAYLPFEHAENLAEQNRSVALFQQLAAEIQTQATPAETEVFNNYLDYAHKHRVIIAEFGRFPHRNAILGRQSSAAEIAFLKQPDSSF